MKTYMLFFTIFLTYTLIYSTSIDSTFYYNQLYQDNLNWDWTDPNAYPDYFYISGKQPIPAVFPFTDANLGVVTEYADYEPEDGWVLLFKDFGSQQFPVKMPYMVLYNKYTGIMRVFVFIVAPQSYYQISLQTYFEDNGSANLNFATNPAVALDKFNSYKEKSIIGYTQGGDSQWIYNDIPIAYDPYVNNSEHVSFIFDIKGIINNQIKIDGKTLLVQKSLANLGQNNKTIFDIIEGAGKTFQDKYNSWNKIKNATSSTFNETANFLRTYGHTSIASALESLSGMVSNLPFGPIGALYGLYKFFSGGGKKIEPTPNVFEGNIQLTGTMETQLFVGKLKLRVPGSIPPTYDYWKPVYDIPMGITNINSTPLLYKTTYFQLNSENISDVVLWNSYKLVSTIDPVVNPNADLTLEDVKAELYFSFSYPYNVQNSQYDILQKWVDDGYIDFKSGKLIVNENNENEVLLTYSTGYLSLDSLTNYFINVPDIIEGSTIYLKIFYRFKRNDDPTADPIVVVNTYQPDVINKDSEVNGPWSFYLNETINGNNVDLKWSDLFKEGGETTLQIQESIDGITWNVIYTKQNPDASFRTYSATPNETGQNRYYRVLLKDNYGMNVYSQIVHVSNPNYSPPTVNISGPSLLQSGQTGTFTANPSGGSGTYVDYRWWERNDEGTLLSLSSQLIQPNAPAPGDWIEITSARGQQTIQRGHSWDFSLKCEITDSDGNTATDIHSVTVGGPAFNVSKTEKAVSLKAVPEELTLSNNYPNPFNPVTSIRFGLPKDSEVTVTIYTPTGERVVTLVDGRLSAGYHQVQWDGTNAAGTPVASGVYVYELKTEQQRLVKKMLLVR